MNTSQQLLQRLELLEARQAIIDLKSRYFACCDAKDVDGFRACFADGKVDIDFAALGQFEDADALTQVYRDMACHPHMLEWHHGSNPQVQMLGPDQARAQWSLHYQLINTQENTLTQLGGEYADRYVRQADAWKISASHFKPRTCLVLRLDETAVATVYAGLAQT